MRFCANLQVLGHSRGSLARALFVSGTTDYATESGIRGVINLWAKPSSKYVQRPLPMGLRRAMEYELGVSVFLMTRGAPDLFRQAYGRSA